MAMHSTRLTQDQDFSVFIDGVNSNGSIAQKNKKSLRGRKTLNDISNSGKPSTVQQSRKHNARNVLPIGEDLGFSGKPQIPVGGRKPLGDLSNSVLPSSQMQNLKKKSKGKQSTAFAENEKLPYTISQQGFLHNHDECIKSQKKSMGLDEFLKIVGLDEGCCFQSVSTCSNPPKDENPMISEPIIEDPICGSPNSPKLPYMIYKKEYDFPRFFLKESPKRLT